MIKCKSISDFRGREEEAEKTLLNLRGPQYMMKAELEELKNILTSQQESAEAGFLNKLKELKSREVYFPVLMMMLMFSLQVRSQLGMFTFYLPHALHYTLFVYHTRTIISRGLYIFYPIFQCGL